MTLSQIIAKESFWDEEIPDKGKYKVFLVIQDGQIELVDITKQKRKVGKVEMITEVAPKETEVARPSPIKSSGRGW